MSAIGGGAGVPAAIDLSIVVPVYNEEENLPVLWPEIRAVLVNLHTAVIGKRRPVDLAVLAPATPAASVDDACTGRRPVWFEAGWIDTPIYRREALPPGARFDGPAVLEQLDATTVIEPDDRVEIDPLGNLIVTIGGRH